MFYKKTLQWLISQVQSVVDQESKYDFQVLLFSKVKGSISTLKDSLKFSTCNKYVCCTHDDLRWMGLSLDGRQLLIC